MSLSKEQILRADDRPTETLHVPEWGGDVIVKTMSGAERDSFEQSIVEGKKANLLNVRARLCVRAVVSEDGKRVFDDDDADQLGKKSAKALGRIYDVAARLNGISKEDVEELGKNSGTGQSAGSTSDSPPTSEQQ